ncbi:GNAT family N-acetyltransferase [Gayadomonas joobiniege]|uniref:GNAT family N-acetyltransferase n=1 Tax=Gayadomonas joobiniege TaxID=1234606 RepID=UPI0003663E9B|nr:GNAT family N-acetyltransferase [Gayadomonas joobiniege]
MPDMPANLTAAYLSAEDMNIASSLLYLAYQDDPFFKHCFNEKEDGYDARLRAAIREELLVYFDKKQPIVGIYDGEHHPIAIACVTLPNAGFGENRPWHWRLKMMLTTGFVSTRNMMNKDALVRQSVPASHYHLISFVAVHPNYQKQGLGQFLLSAIDSVVNETENSEGVAVLATVEKYKTFFEQANYRFIKQIRVDQVVGDLMFKTANKMDENKQDLNG